MDLRIIDYIDTYYTLKVLLMDELLIQETRRLYYLNESISCECHILNLVY